MLLEFLSTLKFRVYEELFGFVVVLIKIDALDVFGLLISAFGLLSSLVANIVSVLESR